MELNYGGYIFLELKKVIRDRGLSYRQVADSIELSESAFKKLMSQGDCSLQKLESICAAVGIRISDLVNAAEKRELREVQFTKAEEDYFSRNREGFQVYWFLVYERRSLDEVKQIMSMEDKKFFSVLRKLDQLGLLKLLPKDRVTVPTPIGVKWIGKTSFVFDLYKKWTQNLLDRVMLNLKKDVSAGGHFNIRYLRMSEKTWQRLKLDLERIEIEYSNIATAEMRFAPDELMHVRWVTLIDHLSWGEEDLKSSVN